MSSSGCIGVMGAVKKYNVLATTSYRNPFRSPGGDTCGRVFCCVRFMCFAERMRNTFVESIYFKRTTFPSYSYFSSFIPHTRK
jgi:hypothetical protein